MKNFLTFPQLDSALLHKGKLSENDVLPDLRMVFINDKLMKIYRLLDGLNDPWYHKQALAVTVSADVETLTDGQISSYTASTNTIVRNVGTWKLGQLLIVSIFSTGGAHVADFVGIVNSGAGTATATLTVIGTDADKGANSITVTVLKSASNSVIDLSQLYVKNIIRVWDNAYVGGKVRVFTPVADPTIFSMTHSDPFFKSRVAYYHRGNTVELTVGTSAAPLATVNFEYRGKPAPCIDLITETEIDIPPEDNQILMDEVLSEYLQAANKEVPADVAARVLQFQKVYDAAMADVAKQQEVKGKRG